MSETVKFSQLSAEDLRFGRGTFEVTLADGRSATLSEINLDKFDAIFSTDSIITNAVVKQLTLRSTSSGTPAAGLGTRLLFQAESADENPSDLGALEFAFSDIGAGTEDSDAYLMLRRAGGALSRAFKFTNTGNFLLTLSAALTAARTITFPDVTSTVVMLSGAQTLVSKTLTDSIHNAGAGSETMRPQGVINVDTTAAATGANTNETDLISYTLPADTLDADGKGLRVKVWGKTGANTSGKTVRLYFGSTVVVSNDITTSPNNLNWSLEYLVIRTGASAEDAIGSGVIGSSLQTTSFNAAAEDTTGTITIKVSGQNGVATANDITAEGMTVEFLN